MKTTDSCSHAIKRELKAAFPGIKFSVKYSRGGAVLIKWTDGPITKTVDEITGKYQYGHFDGMIDCYEYSNNRDDIPQEKYIFCERDHSDVAIEKAISDLREKYGFTEEATAQMYHNGNTWGIVLSRYGDGKPALNLQDALYRYFNEF